MNNIIKFFFLILITTALMTGYAFPQADTSDANIGYAYLSQGKTQEAIESFEKHISKNPSDTKIYLQLSYEYLKTGNTEKAKKYLEYVKSKSQNPEEKTAAENQLSQLQGPEEFTVKNNFIDLYSFNFYDSYQDNVIANLLIKYNNKIINNIYAGLYVDIYTDTRTTLENILNDRFVEAGGFVRFVIIPSLSFEVRAGYVREVDYDKNSFNIKPILMYADKFSTNNPGTNYYLSVYSAGMYDHKFKNLFGQLSLMEAISLPVSSSSSIEPYIRQALMGDTKRFSYNNFYEFGGGVQYVFGSMFLPTFFVEGTEKVYFSSDQKSTFQIKAGILFNFYKFVW